MKSDMVLGRRDTFLEAKFTDLVEFDSRREVERCGSADLSKSIKLFPHADASI
jgi:hypothetical protein